jgi:hypothetical protein
MGNARETRTAKENPMSKFALSKTAQALVEDAKAAGFKVEVKEWSGGIDIAITDKDHSKAEAFLHFGVQNVAPMNSRLGFATSYKAGFRFQYATGMDYAGRYTNPNSMREVRFTLGLAL